MGGPSYRICHIAFEFMSYKVPCEMNGSVSVEALSDIHFKTINYEGTSPAVNLSIIVEQTNATVTVMCRNVSEQPITLPVPLSVTTSRTVSQTEQSTLQSYPVESSSISISTIAITQSTLTTPNTPTNETTLTQSQEIESNNDSQTVIIAGACGGAGGILFLVLVTLLLLYFYRSQVQKTSTAIPSKVAYFSSAFDIEVTGTWSLTTVLFAGELKYALEPLDEADIRRNSVQSDTQKQSHETDIVVTYQNLQVDNYDETFNKNNLDLKNQKHKIPTVTQFNNLQLDEDGGTYNTVDFKGTTETQTKPDNKAHHSSKLESDPFYDIVGQNRNEKTSVEMNNSTSTQNQEPEAAYAVVNKTKSNDIGHRRPKQFQVPESGDTYALVNKEC